MLDLYEVLDMAPDTKGDDTGRGEQEGFPPHSLWDSILVRLAEEIMKMAGCPVCQGAFDGWANLPHLPSRPDKNTIQQRHAPNLLNSHR